ncbi:hypothetical protein [Niabella ginsengisoli]|uniref:Uncharacterized protein n=1 Tax=Niabella ginsengisoli TaxID=522298 RepID=A0ABS9SRP1_9BACT|nr:hypothetical protein [Niabella ginsengisoli]MCH5600941.1 hypothetical protein [Niabella ginsengisoli]
MQHGDIIRFFPSDFRTKDPNLARWDDPKVFLEKMTRTIICFSSIRYVYLERWNWFQKESSNPARSVDELEELFYWCTANNNIMILNVPPTNTARYANMNVFDPGASGPSQHP